DAEALCQPRYFPIRRGLRFVEPGGSIDETATGEVSSARPGSWSRAEAWDGSPGNLGDPARVHGRDKPERGTPADQMFQARRRPPRPSGAPRRARTREERVGPATEVIRERECAGGKSERLHITCESGEPGSPGPDGGKGGAMSREPLALNRRGDSGPREP